MEDERPDTIKAIRQLQREIDETKQRGLKTGEDVKPLLMMLRRQHYRLTGMDGT